MRINLSGSFSLGFGGNSLLQFFSICGDTGIEIKLNDYNCFWAFIDMGDNDFKLLAFQDESWFKDWLKAQPKRKEIKVIQSQEIVKKEAK